MTLQKSIVGGVLLAAASAVSGETPGPQGLDCMTQALYFEARSEGWRGMLLVAAVVKNRASRPQWPATICEVIRQGPVRNGVPVRNACQFSFWCDSLDERMSEEASFLLAKMIAEAAMYSFEIDGFEGITHYHATWVQPHWPKLSLVGQWGSHKFYR